MKTACVFFVVAAALSNAASGQQAQQSQQARDMKLENAGFVMRIANTPDKVARMKLLPPLQFVARTHPSGRYYLFVDPDLCQCVFVGNEQAMQTYRRMVAAPGPLAPTVIAPSGNSAEGAVIREMNEDLPGGGDPMDDILAPQF